MDVNLCDFLETYYLQEQVDAIKEIADHVTNLKRVGEGLGVYMFDKTLHGSNKEHWIYSEKTWKFCFLTINITSVVEI